MDDESYALVADNEKGMEQEHDFVQSSQDEKGRATGKIEDDETLLNEVDEEMARGVVIPAKISSAQQTTPITGAVELSHTQSSLSLEVVEEKDEAIAGRLEDLEENVDRLNQIIRDTELCLNQVSALDLILAISCFQYYEFILVISDFYNQYIYLIRLKRMYKAVWSILKIWRKSFQTKMRLLIYFERKNKSKPKKLSKHKR